MVYASIWIKPVENLIFRGMGEFSPEARFLYGESGTYPLPPPSTVLGFLGYLIGRRPSNMGNWIDEFNEALENTGLKSIRGPYLVHEKDGNIDIYLWKSDNSYISLSGLNKYFNKSFPHSINCTDSEDDMLDMSYMKVRLIKSVGIHLQRGYSLPFREKTINKGFLYFQNFLDLRSYTKEGDINIVLDVKMADEVNNIKSQINGKVIKIGGESRVAKLFYKEISMHHLIPVTDESYNSGELIGLYIASPLLLGDDLDISEDIFDQLERILSNLVQYIGELKDYRLFLDVIGTGYNSSRKIRRPLYKAITPGSIIIVKLKKKLTFEDIYWKPFGVGGKFGYGTVVPVKLIQDMDN